MTALTEDPAGRAPALLRAFVHHAAMHLAALPYGEGNDRLIRHAREVVAWLSLQHTDYGREELGNAEFRLMVSLMRRARRDAP